MGVYIRDMEMPNHCGECGIEWCERWKRLIVAGMPSAKERPEDCPLVPVLPHGRLIDADALLMRISHEVMEAYMDGACYGVHPSQEYLYLLGEIIEDAPTIIPAEEGE